MRQDLNIQRQISAFVRILPTVDGYIDAGAVAQAIMGRTMAASSPAAAPFTALWSAPGLVNTANIFNGIFLAKPNGAVMAQQAATVQRFTTTIGINVLLMVNGSVPPDQGTRLTGQYILDPSIPQFAVMPGARTLNTPLPMAVISGPQDAGPKQLLISKLTAVPGFSFVESHTYDTNYTPPLPFAEGFAARLQPFCAGLADLLAPMPAVTFGPNPGESYLVFEAAVTTDVSLAIDPKNIDNAQNATTDLYIISTLPSCANATIGFNGYSISGNSSASTGNPAGTFNRGAAVASLTYLKTHPAGVTISYPTEYNVANVLYGMSTAGAQVMVPISMGGQITFSFQPIDPGTLYQITGFPNGTLTTL